MDNEKRILDTVLLNSKTVVEIMKEQHFQGERLNDIDEILSEIFNMVEKLTKKNTKHYNIDN